MRKGAAFWNEHDTKVFCEICREETDAGNTVDGYLSAEGYTNLQLKFNARTQRGYVKRHFKYRWNSLKYVYAKWLELISSAGLGWDPETGTFGADEDWWTDHIQINRWHAEFRNGPPDNLSLLEEIFGEARVGKSLVVPAAEDLGEDKQEAAQVDTDGSNEDAELTLTAMRKANSTERKVSYLVVDVLTKEEDENPLLLEYKKEDLGEDREEANLLNIDGSDEHAELAQSAMKKAKLAKREDYSSPMVAAALTTKEDKNPLPQNYKKAHNDLAATVEVSSCDSSTVPTIREAVALIRECGVSEATDLFYTATKIVAMNPECRELFALIRTKEGRLDWLQRAHDDAAMRVQSFNQ